MGAGRITVALDAMGGDHGVRAVLGGAARLSLEASDVHVLAVGDVGAMSAVLGETPHDPRRITLVAAWGVVPMDAKPQDGLNELPDCSVARAARLVASGEADALVSAGNTGATVLASARTFHLIRGVPRAALASVGRRG